MSRISAFLPARTNLESSLQPGRACLSGESADATAPTCSREEDNNATIINKTCSQVFFISFILKLAREKEQAFRK
ncbi:hypothetical protein L195_g054092 [Trifolium pratense]|uniref:Uncharacterized protein n=1 Tax=Trifolium pratense TaxID=57577 RepID=A0A2K3KE77_TRIPR|nr:hypothetical protein L195_g054092 [Trifolium pratense]